MGVVGPTGTAITKSQQNNLVTRNKEIVPVQSYWGTNVDGGKVESIEYCSRHTQDEEDGTEDTKDFSLCVHYEVKKRKRNSTHKSKSKDQWYSLDEFEALLDPEEA